MRSFFCMIHLPDGGKIHPLGNGLLFKFFFIKMSATAKLSGCCEITAVFGNESEGPTRRLASDLLLMGSTTERRQP